MTSMLNADTATSYSLQVLRLSSQRRARRGQQPAGLYGDAGWKAATQAKVGWVSREVDQARVRRRGRGQPRVWIVSDVDVAPLTSFIIGELKLMG